MKLPARNWLASKKPHALTAALLLCAPFAQAQQAPAATDAAGYVPGGRIPQLQGEIAIDGKLDDAAWANALVQEIAYDIQPGDNTPAPVKTTVRIGYTADAIYFAFHALEVESLRYIGGYGRMSWVSAGDWYGAAPDPLAASAKGMIDHMNDDHADALVLYAKAFTSAHDATEVTMTAIDRYGFEMTVTTPRGRGPARLAFEQELATPKDARVALVALVGEARKKLSGG